MNHVKGSEDYEKYTMAHGSAHCQCHNHGENVKDY